ncbi:MAG: hypothetical protein JWM44_2449 [Bacilli bacterium]|nr:hypothetical protein [Bacilli bacterium]
MIWIWLVLIIACVAIVLFICHLRIWMFFSRMKDNDYLFIEIKAFGFLRYRYEIPYIQYHSLWGGILVKMGTTMAATQHELHDKQKQQLTPHRISKIFHWGKKLLAHVFEYTAWLKQTLMHVKCTEFRWDTRVGIGDAAETALTTGVIWAVKSSLFGYVFHYVKLDTKPIISVQPQYNDMEFSTKLSCVAKIRIGYMLFAFLRLFVRILKTKDGVRVWRNILSKA